MVLGIDEFWGFHIVGICAHGGRKFWGEVPEHLDPIAWRASLRKNCPALHEVILEDARHRNMEAWNMICNQCSPLCLLGGWV